MLSNLRHFLLGGTAPHRQPLPYAVVDTASRARALRNRLSILRQELLHTDNPELILAQIAAVALGLKNLGAAEE